MNYQLVERIMDFVSTETRVRVSRLNLETKLQEDLGIDGADGWELIEEFSRRFNIDISTFQAKKHFGPEGFGCPLLCLMLPSVFGEISDLYPDIKQISISDLVEAAEARRWLK